MYSAKRTTIEVNNVNNLVLVHHGCNIYKRLNKNNIDVIYSSTKNKITLILALLLLSIN